MRARSWCRFFLTGLPVLASLVAGTPACAQTSGGAVRPGDRIALAIRDEMVDTIPVTADGRVPLPFVGLVSVVGLETRVAEDSLVRALSRVLVRPDLRATVLRRVIVDGAVRRSGVLYLDETMGLSAAIALMGGVAEEGNARRIELWREGRRIGRYSALQLAVDAPPLMSGDHVWVARSPWVTRNAFLVATVASNLLSIVVFLLSR